LKGRGRHVSLRGMRNAVAALVSLAGVALVTGCAASPAPHAVVAPSGPAPAPHPLVAEATPAGGEASPEQEPKSEHASRQMNRVLGLVVLSVGIEGGILATVTSFMMLHQNSVRNDDCVNKVCSAAGIAANGKMGDLAGWNAAGWGVGVVGVAAGVFILVTNPTDRSLGTQVGVGPTGSGSGLLLRGAF
jgi:hypothetical protein